MRKIYKVWQLALRIHVLHVCTPGLLSLAHLWTDIKPDSNVKGNKKRKGKGKDKNKTAPGEGLADRKRPKIEELKVNIAISFCCFVLLYFARHKKWDHRKIILVTVMSNLLSCLSLNSFGQYIWGFFPTGIQQRAREWIWSLWRLAPHF